MNGEITTYQAIAGNSTITDLLSDVGGIPCVSLGIAEPETWDNTMNTISLYAGPTQTIENWTISEISANIRGRSYAKCNEIAAALKAALNRQKAGLYGLFTVDMGQTIPPQTPEDSHNKPITIYVRATKEID